MKIWALLSSFSLSSVLEWVEIILSLCGVFFPYLVRFYVICSSNMYLLHYIWISLSLTGIYILGIDKEIIPYRSLNIMWRFTLKLFYLNQTISICLFEWSWLTKAHMLCGACFFIFKWRGWNLLLCQMLYLPKGNILLEKLVRKTKDS